MARHPDGEDATPTATPAPSRGRTDVIVARAVKAARETLPADNDQQSIAALASIVNRALMLVGLVVLVLGGMVGVYLSVPGLGRAVPAAPPSSPPAASPVAPGVP